MGAALLGFALEAERLLTDHGSLATVNTDGAIGEAQPICCLRPHRYLNGTR